MADPRAMISPIPLPPLPLLVLRADSHYQDEGLADQLRARDQEIVRCVLQAAADACKALELAAWREYKIGRRNSAHTEGLSDGAGECVAVIKALEFRHHE